LGAGGRKLVGKAKRGRCKTCVKSESWQTLSSTKRSLRLTTLKEFLKVLVGILTLIPLRRFGIFCLITLADQSIILPIRGFSLINISSELTFWEEWPNRMVCAMLLKEKMMRMGTMRVHFTILREFLDITLILKDLPLLPMV
jgi:hypothetical protein